MQEIIKIKCKKCKSNKIVKSGFVIKSTGKKQRYQCKKCGHLFTEE